MIPDFRTYIGESVWSDMHRRSNGSQERKEDSLDNMTLQGFYDYWHKRYNVIGKTGRAWKDMECMNNPIKKEHVVSTPIEYTHNDGFAYTYCIEMTYNYRVEEIEELKITYFSSFILDYPDFRDVFGSEYDVNENGIISIVNGNYKFHHYIDIIDKCVNMVKKPYVEIVMNESVWSDMHRRSNGVKVRKEDDVDILNLDEFVRYVLEHYKFQSFRIGTDTDVSEIYVPVLQPTIPNVGDAVAYGFVYNYDKYYLYVNKDFKNNFPEIFNMIKDRYSVSYENDGNIRINPKNGSEPSKKFIIELIDFVIDNEPDRRRLIIDRI